jgi:hypothetical protein
MLSSPASWHFLSLSPNILPPPRSLSSNTLNYVLLLVWERERERDEVSHSSKTTGKSILILNCRSEDWDTKVSELNSSEHTPKLIWS